MTFALCNELFGSTGLNEAARICAEAGYSGIEFAPFTVFGSFSPADVKAGIADIKKALSGNSLAFAGFHWLLVDPGRSFSLVNPDKALRDAAAERLRLLLSAAGELGGGVLVLGSPKQRASAAGQSSAEASVLLLECFRSLGDYAVKCNSSLLIEALDHSQCDVINTLAEAGELAEAAASPGIGSMFDFHNCGDEKESWDALIRRYAPVLRHVHINEWDGGPPGSGNSDYIPAFRALKEIAFEGWVSMEIFTQPADAAAVVKGAIEFMKKTEKEAI
jgi:sugar phosphate isomerase/epimerase